MFGFGKKEKTPLEKFKEDINNLKQNIQELKEFVEISDNSDPIIVRINENENYNTIVIESGNIVGSIAYSIYKTSQENYNTIFEDSIDKEQDKQKELYEYLKGLDEIFNILGLSLIDVISSSEYSFQSLEDIVNDILYSGNINIYNNEIDYIKSKLKEWEGNRLSNKGRFIAEVPTRISYALIFIPGIG